MQQGWYYVENHKQQGPIDLIELTYLFKSRKLPLNTLVWHRSLTDWVSADSREEFNPKLGKTFHAEPNPPTTPNAPYGWGVEPVTPSNGHPWRRYFARAIDTVLLTPVFSFITGISPVSLTDYRFSMMVITFAILAHAVLQSSWGSTPGKAILGYKIRTRTGHKLSFREAISREARIAWNGLGFGIPLYSFFTQLKAFTDLNNTGKTSWDKAGDLVVTHR
ncbi:MAG: hypothetical protein CMJ93_06240 [Planctomycetes bacterium]|nr:hypothetical protein [Planctomycetota bacterium]